jgi:hypothetical protein
MHRRRRYNSRFLVVLRRVHQNMKSGNCGLFSLIKFYAVEVASTFVFVVFVAFEALRAINLLVR